MIHASFKKLVLASFIALFATINLSHAQDFLDDVNETIDKETSSAYFGEGLSIAECAYKGNIDFMLFLEATMFSDSFNDAVLEPIADVVARNQCQSADISSLIKQRSQIRSLIRSSFLECENDNIPYLREAYYKTMAEIYYVRHVVDASLYISLPGQFLNTKLIEDEDSLYLDSNILYDLMLNKYVINGEISREEFPSFFADLESRYQSRKKDYIVCESDSFSRVVDKFNEFIDNLGGVSDSYEYADAKLGGSAEKITEAITEPGLSDYLNSLVNFNINSTSPEKAFSEIYADNKYLFDSYDYTELSNLNLVDAITEENLRFSRDNYKATLFARYNAIYSDVSFNSINSIISDLNETNQIILDSIDSYEDLLKCTQTMNARQCN